MLIGNFRHAFRCWPIRVGVRSLRSGGKIKGRVITLDDDVGNEIGPGEDFPELNRNLQRMFGDPENTQSPEELAFEEGKGYSALYEDRDFAFHAHLMDQKEQRRRINHQIAKRHFKEPPETNLLTYAAKKQICYLHQLDPLEWTPKRLSQCFPVSLHCVKRLIKYNPVIENEEEILKHDRIVASCWEALKNNGDLSKISPVTLRLWQQGKLVRDFYSGNVNLPEPPEKPIIERTKPKKVGEHVSIIQKYIALKKEKEGMKLLAENSSKSCALQNRVLDKKGKAKDSVIPRGPLQYPSRSDMEDASSMSFLATEQTVDLSKEAEVTMDQFRDNLHEEFLEKTNKTDIDEAYFEWLKEEKQREDLGKVSSPVPYNNADDNFHTPLKKSKQEIASELTIIDDADSMERSKISAFIKIPPKLRKKGCLYRIGKSFYDHTGELLYRVPFIQKE